jgi:NAD(P)-dependent dehydrogenase (short-subunit alcohol dehydrogenase family)
MITGASPTGVGGTVALALAGHQPVRLILTSRVASKLEPLISNIRAINPRIEIQAVELDLGSQHSIRQAAKDVLSSVSTIDILINNAGTANHPDRTLTAEGIEVHFATNHVGHFLLTCLLAPLLIKATAARVVGVSSIKHYMSPVRFSDYNFDGVKDLPFDERPVQNLMEMWKITPPEDYGYETMLCYSQSKTAVVLFGVGLSKRLSSMGVKAFSVHPGG